MIESLTYVEVDTPRCSLTFGTGACAAKFGYVGGGLPGAIGFDGASSLERGAGLTGAADSKLLTFAGWVMNDAPGTAQIILTGVTTVGGATARFSVFFHTDNNLYFHAYNSAGTLILNVGSAAALTAGRWYSVLASFDLSDTGKRHLRINDASSLSVLGYTNDTIDFTVADWGVGAFPSGSSFLTGRIAELWFAPGVYIDFSVEANRREFVTADLRPVDLGANGETPTGTAPRIFLNYLADDFDATNLGTGGAFADVGTPAEATFASGTIKCFNTRKTCQAIPSFSEETHTVRFCEQSDHYPVDIEAIPSLVSVNYTPGVVSLGENLGQRASLSVTFRDHPWSDTGGFDPYLDDRDYDPFTQGTFWAKFRGRHRSLRGKAIRFIQGHVGQELSEMETRNFLVESFEGPSADGIFTIIAKDVLKFADGDRSQAPVLSNGFLNAAIDADDLSLTLSPAGIGNEEYPTGSPDYYVAIGGKEIVKVTSRSGDVLTIVRAQFNTEAVAHAAQDRAQVCLVYEAQTAEFILNDLFVNYAGIPASWIPYESWELETASKLGQLYSRCIPEPTAVDKLASEIVQVCGLAVYPDEIAAKIRLQVLGTVATDAALFDRSNMIEGSFDIQDQPNRRRSQIWVYFAQFNPLKKIEDVDNYRSVAVMADFDSEVEYGSAAIGKIFAPWIPDLGRQPALRVGALQLGRFVDPPRLISFDVHREHSVTPTLGGGYQVQNPICLQDETGAAATAPIQVTRLKPEPGRYRLEAQEMLFTAQDDFNPDDRSVIIDGNRNNINLRDAYDLLYPTPDADTIVNCIIEENVVVGSTSSAVPALDIGSWPAGVEINLTVYGRIQARGGTGGFGRKTGTLIEEEDGGAGGTALKTTVAINLDDEDGEIWGGGGGGGGGSDGGGGGGGAGTLGGVGGAGWNTYTNAPDAAYNGADGTTTAGGVGGNGPGGGSAEGGGTGGGPGLAGAGTVGTSSSALGGAAGNSIDGISLVTTIGSPGDRVGPQVN